MMSPASESIEGDMNDPDQVRGRCVAVRARAVAVRECDVPVRDGGRTSDKRAVGTPVGVLAEALG